jgi:hypothetical protein
VHRQRHMMQQMGHMLSRRRPEPECR